MTAIVGIRWSDGVVIGADSSATFGDGRLQTIEQPMKKVEIIEHKVMVAGTGAVGLGQRFSRLVRMAYRQNLFAGDDHIEVGKALSRAAIDDFASTHEKAGQYGALVVFLLGDHPRLCEFALADFQPEFKDKRIWYVSKGSGQPITDPFLALMRSVFWKDRPPSVQDGTFAVTWALEHAIEANPGGINGPIRVAVLERGTTSGASLSARFLDDWELEEHKENIAAAKDQLRALAARQEPGRQPPGAPKVGPS